MVIASYADKNEFLCQWVLAVTAKHCELAPLPPLTTVVKLCEQWLPLRVKRLGVCLEADPADVSLWLRVVMKMSQLAKISDPAGGTTATVGLYPTRALQRAGWETIQSEAMTAVRDALGIDRHWVVLLGEVKPRPFELFDAFYECLDSPEPCRVIDFR